MNRRELFDVVVVGAGMVGSAAALLLMRQGLRVALVEERAPRPWLAHDEVDLRVVALAPSSIKLFEDLDVWTSIRAARASAYRRMRVWDASAAGELNFDAADRGDAALGYIVEIRLIQHMLWQVLSASSVALFCPVKIVSLESAEQARIVVLADGTRLRTRLVIAADGLLRRCANGRVSPPPDMFTIRAPWSRMWRPSGRTSTPRGSAFCRAVRLRFYRSRTGAARSCGRRRRNKRKNCLRWTMSRFVPNWARRLIFASVPSRLAVRAQVFRCACNWPSVISPNVWF